MNEITRQEHLPEKDGWEVLRQFTDARIALGHAGTSLPTAEYLSFTLAHAQARDAVNLPLDKEAVRGMIEAMELQVIEVQSNARDRKEFLTRPDFGRRLCEDSRERLKSISTEPTDIVFVIGDGLSSKAIHRQAVPLLRETLPYMSQLNLSVAPIIMAEQCRVALGDEIAQILNARMVAMLIGERPGLSSPDSLSVYLTYAPHVGSLDSERNCISNIRPEGLTYPRAAFKLAWLVEAALAIGKTGTALKDQSDDPKCRLSLKPLSFLDF